jgi:hypothetical protein
MRRGDVIDITETAPAFSIDLTSVEQYAQSVMQTEAGGAT